ncbi:hypothetical protein DPEC_G00293660 [Dallia pectoralis]|uniref:Uncharacterized protein n=1 Tax=Dallia pectoralis TaxID=75939 RepID=A0ACC2FIF5_DALPE|nr:hypothetical protein DPEC_G00293660 [Dallia pectoralis]
MWDDVQKNVSAGVAAARNMNMAEITQLHDELNSIEQEIESMEKKQEVLEKQNSVLYPEREMVKGDYENVINQFNYQLSEKANKQIVLNETVNKIREVKNKIPDLETAKVKLGEDMIHEKKAFAKSKDNLQKECQKTTTSITQQKKRNAKKRRELDIVLSELLDKEDKVTELKQHVAQLERSIARLTASKIQSKVQLVNAINKVEELAVQKEFHGKELAEVRMAFELKGQALEDRIEEVDIEWEEGQKVNAVLLDSRVKLSDKLKAQRKEEEDATAEHQIVSRRLEKSNLRLEERIASIVKHKMEIKEMEEEIKQLHKTNIVNADLFERNIEDLQGQLNKEKKNIVMFEGENEKLCQSLEDLKKDHEQHVKEVNSNIDLARKRHEELLDEEKKLQEHILMDMLINRLSNQIVEAKEEYEQMTVSYKAEIQQLITEAESVNQSRLEEEERVMCQESVLVEVEAQFDFEQSRHQKLTEHISELESRKNHLGFSVQDMKEKRCTLLKPMEEMKRSLASLQEKHMELRRSHASDISTTERNVYENGVMLEQVSMENSRLHVCIEQMKEDISNARKDKERHMQEIGWLKEEVHSLLECLLDARAEDMRLTKKSSEEDQQTLQAIHRLGIKIHNRMSHLGDINSKLQEELKGISSLLTSHESNITRKE